jgi:hypothetical protein
MTFCHQRIDSILTNHAYRLLSLSPPLLQAYLAHRGDENKCQQVWHLLLAGISQHSQDSTSALSTLLGAAEKGSLPSYLRPNSDELSNIVGTLFTEGLDGPGTSQLILRRQLIQYSGDVAWTS